MLFLRTGTVSHLPVYLDTRSSMGRLRGWIYIYHCDTGIRVHGYRTAVYTYRYTLTHIHGSQHVPWRRGGNLPSLLWLWQTPALPLAGFTPLGCSTPRTWSSIGNLRTSLAALATDGIWRWPKDWSDWLLRVLRASSRSKDPA